MRSSSLLCFLNRHALKLELLGILVTNIHIWFIGGNFSGIPLWLATHIGFYLGLMGGFIAVYGLIVGAIIYCLGFIGRRSRSPKDWKLIQYLLDKAQEIAYPQEVINDAKHEHRVTLFRYQSVALVKHWTRKRKGVSSIIWPWGEMNPWSGWLVPIRRSGHTSQNSRTRFLARENGTSEGVCGLAWSADKTMVLRGLPKVSAQNKHNRQLYADSTNCSKEMIDYMLEHNGGTPPPRSIGAIPVWVKGKLWGVLVFDSKTEDAVSRTIEADFQITVGAIEQILERD